MKRLLLLFAIMLTAAFGLRAQPSYYAQPNHKKIDAEKVFVGHRFSQNGRKLSADEMVALMRPNKEAYAKMRAAKSTHTIASIISGVGGFMVGYPLGAHLSNGEPNWAMAGIGAGLMAVSIPISIRSNRQTKTAVDFYNRGPFEAKLNQDQKEFALSSSANGLGIALRF